jgi:2-polyprenyl-3-methyl-5-hydroxy-6-metoxy-1,4-benzoquinol methylase
MVIERSQDPDAFAAFELVGWDANIAGYDQAFGVVARQAVSPILEATHVGSGTRVLDVCCGPGILTAGALARGAEVIGLDFASEAGLSVICVQKVPLRKVGKINEIALRSRDRPLIGGS